MHIFSLHSFPSSSFTAFIDKILKVSADFQETLDSNFGGLVEKMSYYLGDRKTESILLKVIKVNEGIKV